MLFASRTWGWDTRPLLILILLLDTKIHLLGVNTLLLGGGLAGGGSAEAKQLVLVPGRLVDASERLIEVLVHLVGVGITSLGNVLPIELKVLGAAGVARQQSLLALASAHVSRVAGLRDGELLLACDASRTLVFCCLPRVPVSRLNKGIAGGRDGIADR